jgi:hypothetical protein
MVTDYTYQAEGQAGLGSKENWKYVSNTAVSQGAMHGLVHP